MEKQGIAKEKLSTAAAPSMQTIQDWHVVLGDPHAAYRTTAATDLLRHVKQEFKQKFRGQASAQWISAAIKTFYQRLRVKFPSVVDDNDLGRVLIKCNAKTMASGRVSEPNLYRFASDTTATYGLAYQESSLNFFLQSRDAPTLAQELRKYQKLLQRWLVSSKLCRRRHQGVLPSHQALRSFIQTMLFFQERLEASQRGDALAKALLQSLGVIPALRIQWSLLQEKIVADNYATDDNNEVEQQASPNQNKALVIPWERLELQLQQKTATASRLYYKRQSTTTTTTTTMRPQAPISLPISRPLLLSQASRPSCVSGEHSVHTNDQSKKRG